ncbi:hypothetical protein MMC20_001428 [Loxospora ochrophaea]|nr:hypothetical protein [Loxospora ochrophaea]
MSRQSHFLLYAISPIGLVTAIVTLIRLQGSPLMKRVIGRQFETKAEVLAEVTGTSYGDVGLKFRNGTSSLEQTVSPSIEEQARFAVYLKHRATRETAVQNLRNRVRLIGEYRKIIPKEQVSWCAIDVFRVHRTDMLESLRLASWWMYPENLEQHMKWHEENLTKISKKCTVDVSGMMYIDAPGVSPTLLGDHKPRGQLSMAFQRQLSSYITTIVCGIINIAIIGLSVLSQTTLSTLILMSIGLSGSFLGSWVTAYLIYAATCKRSVSLLGFHVLESRFFSIENFHGASLGFLPSTVGFFTTNTKACASWIVGSTVLFSALTYVALYLGLRSTVWWAPLAILANGASAAFLRAILTDYSIFDKEPSANKSKMGEDCQWIHALSGYMSLEDQFNHLPPVATGLDCQAINEKHELPGGKSSIKDHTPSTASTHTILNVEGQLLSHSHLQLLQMNLNQSPECLLVGIDGSERKLLYKAFAIAFEVYRLNKKPQCRIVRQLGGDQDIVLVASEFIGRDRIWRQDLDVRVTSMKGVERRENVPDISKDISVLLRVWVTMALFGDVDFKQPRTYSAQAQSAVNSIPSENGISWNGPFLDADRPFGQSDLDVIRQRAQGVCKHECTVSSDRTTQFLRADKVMLWMAVKMVFLISTEYLCDDQKITFPRVAQSHMEKVLEEYPLDTWSSHEWFTATDSAVAKYVRCLDEVGLLMPA